MTATERLITDRATLLEVRAEMRADGRSLALVPTMGFLHEGHLRLVDEAREQADRVLLTLFVNPLQFAPGEDLDRYPKGLARDRELAFARGVDVIYAPSAAEMFPDGPPSTRVDPGPLGRRLCGVFRPTHFPGVLTIVARLFGLISPQVAVFGRKDFQQAVLVRRMVRDLEYPVNIRIAPLVRAPDGLALSSRNAYLSEEERGQAQGLFSALTAADETFRAGSRDAAGVLGAAEEALGGFPGLRVQYLELVDPETLEPLPEAREGAVVAVAALCGATRLIDNVVLGAAPDPRADAGVPSPDAPGIEASAPDPASGAASANAPPGLEDPGDG